MAQKKAAKNNKLKIVLGMTALVVMAVGTLFAGMQTQSRQDIQSHAAVPTSRPAPTAAVSRCKSVLKGTCLNRNTTRCYKRWNSGPYCPGGNNIQCCY